MSNNVFNGNHGIATLCLSTVMLIGLTACGGGGGSDDSGGGNEYTPPPDVSIEDTPIDDVPLHQEMELQEYMLDTIELRSPIGNIYEMVEGDTRYYVYFNNWEYGETIVQTYAFDSERSCYRAPRGNEPNAALNHALIEDHGVMETLLYETPSVTFYLDGPNTWDSYMRDDYERVTGIRSSQYRIEWSRDAYGILDEMTVIHEETGEVIETAEGELHLEIESGEQTAVLALNVDPVDMDPAEFEAQRCDDSLYQVYTNPAPMTEDGEADTSDPDSPYYFHPGYTVFMDERSAEANKTFLESHFHFELYSKFRGFLPAPRDNKILAFGLAYDPYYNCYQVSQQEYNFYYEPVRDRYVAANWLLTTLEMDPIWASLDRRAEENPLTLKAYTASDAYDSFDLYSSMSGTSVYVPYDEQEPEQWRESRFGTKGLSVQPSSLTLEEIAPLVCPER